MDTFKGNYFKINSLSYLAVQIFNIYNVAILLPFIIPRVITDFSPLCLAVCIVTACSVARKVFNTPPLLHLIKVFYILKCSNHYRSVVYILLALQ